jgi:hypothetical protein
VTESNPRPVAAHAQNDRREFLKRAGKAALAVPPVVTMVMSASSKPAHAGAKNGYGGNGYTKKKNHTSMFSGKKFSGKKFSGKRS